MFGNVLNNSQLFELIRQNIITISPFDQDKCKTIHYPLTAYTLLKPEGRSSDGEFRVRTVYQYQTDRDHFRFEPDQYLIVEIEEFITLRNGIVGHFIPASNLIHQGFGLTAGRIEAPFGQEVTGRAKVRFGIKNLLREDNFLIKTDILAYVYFVDLRGLGSVDPKLTERDRVLFDAWKHRRGRFEDEGPSYQN